MDAWVAWWRRRRASTGIPHGLVVCCLLWSAQVLLKLYSLLQLVASELFTVIFYDILMRF